MVAAIAVLVTAGVLTILVNAVVLAAAPALPGGFLSQRSSNFDWWIFEPSALVGAMVLAFACGVLCSTFVTRPLTAAAAGLAVAMGIASSVFLAWSALDLNVSFEAGWFGVQLIAVGMLLLIGSAFVFCWPERAAISAKLTTAGSAAGAMLLLCFSGVPVFLLAATPRVGEVSVVSGSASLSRNGIIMTVRAPNGTTQVWHLYTDGGGAQPVATRGSLAPQWAGESSGYLYYLPAGRFGFDSTSFALQVSKNAWSSRRTVVPKVSGTPRLFFSSSWSGGVFAVSQGNELTLGSLAGRGLRTFDMTGTEVEGAILLGFSNQHEFGLLYFTGDIDLAAGVTRAEGALVSYDAETGETSALQVLPAGTVLQSSVRSRQAGVSHSSDESQWATMGVITPVPRPDGVVDARAELLSMDGRSALTVFDIENAWSDGDSERMFRRCAAVEYVPRRNYLSAGGSYRYEPQTIFGDCSESARAEFPAGAIRLVGSRGDFDADWPLPEGWSGDINRIHLNGARDVVLLDIRGDSPIDNYALTLSLDGTVRIYDKGWTALGWNRFQNIIVLQYDDGETAEFAIGDEETGNVYRLFPDNEWRRVAEQRAAELRETIGRLDSRQEEE